MTTMTEPAFGHAHRLIFTAEVAVGYQAGSPAASYQFDVRGTEWDATASEQERLELVAMACARAHAKALLLMTSTERTPLWVQTHLRRF